jgi:hypothetical protein
VRRLRTNANGRRNLSLVTSAPARKRVFELADNGVAVLVPGGFPDANRDGKADGFENDWSRYGCPDGKARATESGFFVGSKTDKPKAGLIPAMVTRPI